MKVFRLCNKDEVENILNNRNFDKVGHECQKDSSKNTYQYLPNKNYMHFFGDAISLLYLYPSKGKMVCVYDIPDEILNNSKGKGLYLDFINFEDLKEVTEYAIESDKMQFEYLDKAYKIKEDLDFDYVPQENEIYAGLNCVYDFQGLKTLTEGILEDENASEGIKENLKYFLLLIPEIKNMIGFDQRHPHHHLDVWNHTLLVVKNLDSKDLELNMSALLHDIGKPFSYQDEEVRHFHGHAEVSYKMAKQILKRLRYDEEFIDRVAYLVRTHDTIIDPNNLDNSPEMIQKRLQLQYADAMAHRPDKVAKRVKFLDEIKHQLQIKQEMER